MIVLPALDLRDGACVQPNGTGAPRLVSAVDAARGWAHLGFRNLHIVDLDAASNVGSNTSLIEDIVRDGAADLQVGGGVRSTDQAERLFEIGVTRIIVGSRAIEEPEWLADLSDLFPHVVVLAVDLRDGRVVTHGRSRTPAFDVLDVARDAAGLALGGMLVTAVTLGESMDVRYLNLVEDVVENFGSSVFTSGGVAAFNDLRSLENRGVAGVVVGAALSSGMLDPRSVAQEFGE
jgi:phosphoribosylformimino-5-aminoimidazole carboxamide ribotide isomerase